MDNREKIASIVKEKGPLLPAQINKELKTNVLFASAMLSEMVDSKKIRLTSMKIGGSPLYYCEGQEERIEQFAHKLSEQNYKTFELLKNSKVIRDRDQSPQVRVALRELKDFAVPLEVTAKKESDLFWKYYLVPEEDAKNVIKKYFTGRSETREVQAKISDIGANVKPHDEKHVDVPAKNTTNSDNTVERESIPASDISEFSYGSAVSFSTMIDTDEKIMIEKESEKDSAPESLVFPEGDEFFDSVKSFFDSSGVEITGFSNIRKGAEYDFEILLPSKVGMLQYYCKAKSKAKSNEGDLSTAYVQGVVKRLPIIYLTQGELTKRAQEMLDDFKSMVVKRLE
ncbi:hypothetical protein HQ545_00635 [Candidatus Woesearchaeota archaeon]|nr:hypothetical protein [Candidatus Woesearchaeota archaeon]